MGLVIWARNKVSLLYKPQMSYLYMHVLGPMNLQGGGVRPNQARYRFRSFLISLFASYRALIRTNFGDC